MASQRMLESPLAWGDKMKARTLRLGFGFLDQELLKREGEHVAVAPHGINEGAI